MITYDEVMINYSVMFSDWDTYINVDDTSVTLLGLVIIQVKILEQYNIVQNFVLLDLY